MLNSFSSKVAATNIKNYKKLETAFLNDERTLAHNDTFSEYLGAILKKIKCKFR